MLGKDVGPGVAGCRGQANRRTVTIVHYLTGPLVGACLQKVEPESALVGPDDMSRIDGDTLERRDAGIGERVSRQGRYETRVAAECRNRGGDVGLGASKSHVQMARESLAKAKEVIGDQPPHDLTECCDLHNHLPPFRVSSAIRRAAVAR